MKTKIVTKNQAVKEIDWSKPMLVKSKTSSLVVWTDGNHTNNMFSGKVLIQSDELNKVGKVLDDWYKSSFDPIMEPVIVEFIP